MQMGALQLTLVETIGGDKAFLVGLLDHYIALRCPHHQRSSLIKAQGEFGLPLQS